MLDGYIRMLVGRFWEERRLTHPHLSTLYDLASETIRNANIPEEEKLKYSERLMKARNVRVGGRLIEGSYVGGVILELGYLEEIYNRNIGAMLDIDIDTAQGNVNVQDVCSSVKRVLSYITEIVSDVGKLYYMDVQFKNINPQHEKNTVLKSL